MVTVAPEARTFSGTSRKGDAAELFRLMQTVGRFMSVNASVRLSLDSAVEFFADTNLSQKAILAAIAANPDIFQLDETGRQSGILATRAGTLGRPDTSIGRMNFATRLMTPMPQAGNRRRQLRPRPRLDSNWSIFDVQTTDLDVRPAAPLPRASR